MAFGAVPWAFSGAPASPLIGRTAPEIPSLAAENWAGSPVSLASLRGRVVVLNVWTFGCINCRNTLPWLRQTDRLYTPRGVAIVGVHTPEFDREKSRKMVVAAIEREELNWPSYLDNGMKYWDALANHWWPATYLIDRSGIVRYVQVGEIHEGDRPAAAFEGMLERLLAETP